MTEESECGKLLHLPNNPKASYASDSNLFCTATQTSNVLNDLDTAYKVSVFVVFLVYIFLYSD